MCRPTARYACIYFDGEKGIYFIKRFLLENTTNVQTFMPSEHPKSFIEFVEAGRAFGEAVMFLEHPYLNDAQALTDSLSDSVQGDDAMMNLIERLRVAHEGENNGLG